jgi:hypothetical protein
MLLLYCIGGGRIWIFYKSVAGGVTVVGVYFVKLISFFTNFVYMKIF